MNASYAKGTVVPVERTRIEIEETLRRFGADAFSSGYEGVRSFINFRAQGRMVRLVLDLPSREAREFTVSPAGRLRSAESARAAYEAECRRRWRALALLVKAKLAGIADGISTFDAEWLPHIITADGRTVGEVIAPQLGRGEPLRLIAPATQEGSRP